MTAGNPLKGFLTSYAWGTPVTDFPHSLEFAYVPLSALMDGPASFTFSEGLEPLLSEAAARGNQVIFRPYIDHPAQPSGLPDFLWDEVDTTAYDKFGGGWSPDYSNPTLQAAILAFIDALGDRFDGDPRLAVVQVGLLGFWGEWHTWPYEDWFADEALQQSVLEAYDAAFETTLIQVRVPAVNSPSLDIGFHDDSFAYSTIGNVDWFFLPLLEAAGASERWQSVLIGGELRPELQQQVFEPTYTPDTYAQDFMDCVEATHASYMLNYTAFSGDYESDAEREAAANAALALGYEFSISTIAFADGVLSVQIANTGVAPFYHPLSLQLERNTAAPLTVPLTLQPTQETTIQFAVSGHPAPTIEEPWFLSLVSDMVLEGQSIRLANINDPSAVVQVR